MKFRHDLRASAIRFGEIEVIQNRRKEEQAMRQVSKVNYFEEELMLILCFSIFRASCGLTNCR